MTQTSDALVKAIQKLFELNNYKVEGPLHINGAEVDLRATSMTDPFAAPVYVEATIEYVDNEKYGKDLTKLALIGEQDPSARRIIISTRGFSLPVAERAEKTRIQTLTYLDFFRKFERFDPYISAYTGDRPEANELMRLSQIYEEPDFDDRYGRHRATQFLTRWRNNGEDPRWLLITGEYGTGKTALTRILQYRWLENYKSDPSLPIPLRIELRSFTNQFDARGLLHHFMDTNFLSHISIDFIFSLIREGRVILILDGYDEMAQYLHARERRACLEALAQLAAGGARGILTSRPNYFTEAEELHVFEMLYRALDHEKYYLGHEAQKVIQDEKDVDSLLEQFFERRERILKDLTPEQTEALITRVLAEDPVGRDIIIGLLKRIFRDEVSLSGKPVIVTYLLDVVEGLKDRVETEGEHNPISEWYVFKLVVDQLMIRDYKRSRDMLPTRRRSVLQKIAIFLSKRENPFVGESEFRDVVSREFREDIRAVQKDSQPAHLERLFADIRSSATLTRSPQGDEYGWSFSHNTLREYLVAEALVLGLERGAAVETEVKISDAMRLFAASMQRDRLENLYAKLADAWRREWISKRSRGQLLCLLWDGFLKIRSLDANPREAALEGLIGTPVDAGGTSLSELALSSADRPSEFQNSNFMGAVLRQVDFCGADLATADFREATLEDVGFEDANLENASFRDSLLIDVRVSGSILKGADFRGVKADLISLLNDGSHLEGREALGYLKLRGAQTDEVDAYYVYRHHAAFPVVDKILDKLAEQWKRQRRGLEQRGAANQDVNLAKQFVRYLEDKGIIYCPRNRKDLVEVTDHGRKMLTAYATRHELPDDISGFFASL